MKCKLADICEYVKGKIDVSSLTEKNYISTENMIPDKGGITLASSITTTSQTQVYCKGDILISNIRPYFKKIWFAEFDGGCSNDVLVFRAKKGVDKRFLYYVLADDSFFDYSMSTSKGTKMPRGDKTAIMKYEVPDVSFELQERIAKTLGVFDEKIQLNRAMNRILEDQADTIYKAWFEDLIPFEGVQPDTWKRGTFGSMVVITSGKRPPVKSAMRTEVASIPLVGAASVMGYTTEANHTDRILVTGRVGTHGVVQRLNTACWASDNTLVITSKYYEYAYQILKRIDYRSMNRGSTQPLITQGDMNKTSIIIPDKDSLERFEAVAGRIMEQYEANVLENDRLAEIRNFLIPRLLSESISYV